MPSRSAISSAWSASDRQAYRTEMAAHAEGLRKCVKVSGSSVSFSKDCFKKAVPKGILKGAWTE